MTATAAELRKIRSEILEAIRAEITTAEAEHDAAKSDDNDYRAMGFRGELIGLGTAHTKVWEVFQAYIDAA